jgi:hypothetical protein
MSCPQRQKSWPRTKDRLASLAKAIPDTGTLALPMLLTPILMPSARPGRSLWPPVTAVRLAPRPP